MQNFIIGKRWLLGFAIAIVYIPLRTFMNVQHDILRTIIHKLPLFAVEVLVSTLFFTGWIFFVDWGLNKLSERTGRNRSVNFHLLTQLITLIPAIFLAIVFNWILVFTWLHMELWWDHQPLPFSFSTGHLPGLSARHKANQALTILALIAAYYLCVSNQVQENLNKVLVDSKHLEKENIHAHFQALKNQISPHFLFNNLSVLASLVELHPEKSSEFIDQLSTAYRYILQQAELSKISLKDEIAFLETYTFLLRTRFKEKVAIQTSLTASNLETYFLIPLTLQLLIENAIKHNTMSLSHPLVISIYIDKEMLIVSNPLQKRILNEPSTQLGLKNIIARYDLLLKKEVVVETTSENFTVKIPLFL